MGRSQACRPQPPELTGRAGWTTRLPETCDLVAWDSVGAGAFSHLIYLYRDTTGQYLLRDVIALQDHPDQVVYDIVRPIDGEEAATTSASLSGSVEQAGGEASLDARCVSDGMRQARYAKETH